MESYYPVNDNKNMLSYLQYKALADKELNVIFGGRLAEYKYYDMAPIVEQVINIRKSWIMKSTMLVCCHKEDIMATAEPYMPLQVGKDI